MASDFCLLRLIDEPYETARLRTDYVLLVKGPRLELMAVSRNYRLTSPP